MIHRIGSRVTIESTGDNHIDQYLDCFGKLASVREIKEPGCPSFEQVLIRFDNGDEIWVNENEYKVWYD
jgi:hypothetical protein